MEYERLEHNYRPQDDEEVRFKSMGNVSEIFWSQANLSTECNIRKLDKDTYVDVRTGEVLEFNHTESRADNLASVRKTLQNGRDRLNTNVTDVSCCRWVMLSYRQREDMTQECVPMTDPKRLYKDTKYFVKKMRHMFGHFEYITAAEPQRRGAWHQHMMMIFDKKAPYIPKKELQEVWGHGVVWIQKIDDVDNVGAYLTAYLGDMEVSEAIKAVEDRGGDFSQFNGHEIKEVEVEQEDGKKVSKRFIKGGRIHMYPPQFHMFRWSRGIKEPDIELMSAFEAEKKVSAATLTYEKTVRLSDADSGFQSTLNYRYYNTARKNPQECKPK